jgi:preprotein translocase subunit Sss1
MELDTIQKVIGIIGGIVAIFGTIFSVWRDWPKVQERLPKRVGSQKPNKKAVTPDYSLYVVIGGWGIFLMGVVLFIVAVFLSIINSSFTTFILKPMLTLWSVGCFVASGGFLLALFESDKGSKLSNLLVGLLLIGIGFLIYSLIPQFI